MADPTTQYIYQSGFPSEIAPYAQDLVKQASTFTDLTKNPYQQYTGERVAQLSPLTQQAMGTATNMGVAGQIGAGTTLAGLSGLSALTPQSFTMPGTAGAYMSPYMQSVVDAQQREAKRQATIQNQATQAQATQAGAFGGARDAIQRAEANRNLQTQLGNIQAQGLQNAFQQAQQQYNAEQAQRLQGAQTGIQAASVLGTLGGQQATQMKDIVNLQNQLGTQEQQRAQQILDAQYQDYLNYQNFPYKQMGFMSDIIRGVPLTQQSSSIYQSAPTATQNLLSTGLGAAGIANLLGYGRKEGGTVSSYANGGTVDSYGFGGSVLSDAFKEYAVQHIDPRQLPVAQRNAVARGDAQTAMAAQEQQSLDAALRRGIAAATPYDMDQGYADGGIVAFSTGGTWQDYSNRSLEAANMAEETPEQYASGIGALQQNIAALRGPSEVEPIYARQQERTKENLARAEQMGLGSTLLRMAAALQKTGVGESDRYGGMYTAAAEGGEKVQQLRSTAEEFLMKSELAGAQARQAYKDGNFDKAVAAKQTQAANKLKGQELTVRAADTAAQVAGGIERERMQNATQRAVAARPGETERMMAEINAIRTGKSSFAGKTGEEGVAAYTNAMGDIGAARYGVRYTGQDKEAERLTAALKGDDEYGMLKTRRAQLGTKGDLSAKEKALLARTDARIAEIEDAARQRISKMPAPGGGAGGAGDGVRPPAAAVEALRQDPTLKAQFDAKYGRGAADRYIGG